MDVLWYVTDHESVFERLELARLHSRGGIMLPCSTHPNVLRELAAMYQLSVCQVEVAEYIVDVIWAQIV
jgi:hypothetical protein